MAYSRAEQQSHIKPPNAPGTKIGQVKKTSILSQNKYWEWNGTKWEETTEKAYQEYHGGSVSYKSLASPTLSSATGSLRYPEDAAMAKESDYVLFEFYEYQPPFQGINKGATNRGSTGLASYNQSATDAALYNKAEGLKSVVLYMPEDISTGYKANWSGKAFSNIGRDALSTVGSGDFGQALDNLGNTLSTGLAQAIPNIANKAIVATIGKITGEQIGANDLFAATRGVILNPNVELLFSGIDLRNFQLNYKLVPRNKNEASIIRQIVDQFRKAMLPRFAKGNEIVFSNEENIQNNFIRVPNVCKVSFMRGGGLNEYVPQYKMCSITQVDINYTPDGAYATYSDGSMVAIELSLAFQETKLIFAEEVDKY